MTEIRLARADDVDAATELLDAAMLELDRAAMARRVENESVLVAESGERIVGVCVLDVGDGTTEISQIAVHRSRRARGVGRALVESAAETTAHPLTATFRPQVRPFYEALGFAVEPVEGESNRFRGVLR
ncbi:GNAT family N-acetyltransferase [Halogeometricum limi]|uniref:Predicted N-acetyltransferase YhbS n=1 Tax=Halogeometricum limi TaxID=555875 RepID=A0A1I6FUL7_9EURY|nr:GNAT family N-acetyltransferase [Halogeometricum limi]SFR33630.1 Predicted N-acetyltransferase YhbS [Halogeometricum limi]